MDFGSAPFAALDSIDWSFGTPDPRIPKILKPNDPAPFRVHLGLPVWGCPEWVGSVYSSSARPKDFLSEYAQQFQSIELNTSFYRIPEESTLAKWEQETSPDFKFCVKLHQSISHERDIELARQNARRVAASVSRLSSRAGLSFLQLGPAMGPERFAEIQARIEPWIESRLPLAIEFRHPDWFYEHKLRGRAFEWMSAHQIATVITDTAGRRDAVHASLTTDRVLIRFLGNYPHESDLKRFELWADRLKVWREQGLREAYFFLHQHENKDTPLRFAELVNVFNSVLGLQLLSWQSHSLFETQD